MFVVMHDRSFLMYADFNSSLLTRSILSHSMTSGSCFRKTSDDLLCGPARTKVGSPTAFRSSSAFLNSTLLTLLIDFTHADLKDLNVRTVPGVLAIAAATEVGVGCSLTGVVACTVMSRSSCQYNVYGKR